MNNKPDEFTINTAPFYSQVKSLDLLPYEK